MNIDEQIYARLTSTGPVLTAVGDRVYPDHMPQTPTYPAIVYTQISQVEATDGALPLYQLRYQFDCYGVTRPAARTLADGVQDLLRDWSNRGGTPRILLARDDNRLSDYDDETRSYRVMVDVLFWVVD